MAAKRGHPEVYDKAIADDIIARMAAGDTLQEICETPGYPKAATVRYWAATDQPLGFAATFARARELQAGAMFDKLILKSQEKGDWQSLRLQVDTLKWAASKLHPKVYGDSAAIKLSDPDGNPISFTFRLDKASGIGNEPDADAN